MSATLPPPPLALPPPQRHRLRLRWTPFLLGGGLAAGAIFIAWHGFYSMGEEQVANLQPDTHTSNTSASADDVLKDAPAGNEIPAALRPLKHTASSNPPPGTTPQPEARTYQAPVGDTDAAVTGRRQAWQAYYQAVAQLQQQRMQQRVASMQADTEPQETGTGNGNGGPIGTGGGLNGAAGVLAGESGGNPQRDSQRAFLASNGSNPATDYSPFMPTAPLSPYELKVTDVITGKLVSALNSDSPGMVKAIVTKNVLDHATGNHILIPQGSILAGVYDTNVAYGQHRVVVAWQRIIFPPPCDQSLDLGSMPGSDQTGQAGFQDMTDNHLGQVFTAAILMSLFGAGVQLSQPPQSAFSSYNPVQTAGGAVGQQIGQLGQEFARRGLSIPPTEVIRQGYPFSILLTKDVAFEHPWRAGVCEPMEANAI